MSTYHECRETEKSDGEEWALETFMTEAVESHEFSTLIGDFLLGEDEGLESLDDRLEELFRRVLEDDYDEATRDPVRAVRAYVESMKPRS